MFFLTAMFSKKMQRFAHIMKIAVNARFLLPDKLEGIGFFTQEVVRRLVVRRPDDEFLLLFDRPFDSRFIFGPNVQAVVAPPQARHPLLWLAWFELSVPLALARWRPDVFFSPDGYCSLAARTPTLMVTHDVAHLHYPDQIPFAARHYYNFFVPRYLRRADHVATVSAFSKADIIAHYGLPAEKISVAPNGVRPGFRPMSAAEKQAVRARYAQGEAYFFYVGAVHPRKNLARLIAAFDRFRQQSGAPVRLLIAGRMAWQTGAIREAWEAARHQDAIAFLGYVPEEELPGLVGSALALTYVSLFEGFGVPLLEAMHAETPIISSQAASMPEVAGDAALLANPENVAEIAAAMQRLYTDEALRQQLIMRGREQRNRFNWEDATTAIETALMALR